MAANKYARYIWLVDLLKRRKRLTFEEIDREWQQSGLGLGDPLPKRTFHNHIEEIEETFNICIGCDKHNGYKYYIENLEELEGDALHSWLIDSFATLNQINVDVRLKGRVQFEDIPSGQEYLTQIVDAMRGNHVVCITYKAFDAEYANTFEIEPFGVRVNQRRWYVVARSPYYTEQNRLQGKPHPDVILTYALDRILSLEKTEKTFKMPKGFDLDRHFEGAFGVLNPKEKKVERVRVKAWNRQSDYLLTLPLHSSQKLVDSDDESRTFEYRVRPTLDFYQALLAQGDSVEVLEPPTVREEMARFVDNMRHLYFKEEGQDGER